VSVPIAKSTSPAATADAELLAVLIDILRGFELTASDFVVRLSSRTAWQQFFANAGGKPEDEYEFFQIVDKLEHLSWAAVVRQASTTFAKIIFDPFSS